jgi:hypothetical protein
MKLFILVLAVILSLIRPVLIFKTIGKHASQSYQALAHLLVGGLVGAWIILEGNLSVVNILGGILLGAFAESAPWQIRTASMMTLVEIVCAVLTVVRKRQ